MTTINGIYTLQDLYEQRFAPVSTLDTSKVLATIQAYANFIQQDLNEQLNMFTEEITASRAVWGGNPTLAFDEVNEFGKGTPRKEILGQEVHFPLFKLSATVEKTKEAQKRMNAGQLREVILGVQNAYAQRVRDEIKAAIFNKSAHVPVKDWLVDNTTLNKVQPFLNADSAEIPAAPNGATFTASTHSHYAGTSGSALSTYDVNTLISNVREHVLGKVVLFVEGSMPATLAALAGTQYVARPPMPLADNRDALVSRLAFDPDADRNNMSVGYWDGTEVVTRSWVPTNYMAAMAVGGQLGKPLMRRIDPSFQGMLLAADLSDNIVVLEEAYTYLGFGAFNRAAGAALKCDAQTYTNPSGLVRV